MRPVDADLILKLLEDKANKINNLDTINGLIGAHAIVREAPTIVEIKDCRYCTHSDACSPEDTEVKCCVDIGEYVDNPKGAEDCPDFIFDDDFPKW